MKSNFFVSTLTALTILTASSNAFAGVSIPILGKLFEPFLQKPIEPKATSFVIEDKIEIKSNEYTAFYRMRSIEDMIRWSPNTSFQGRHDVNDRVLTEYALATGKEKFEEIVLENEDGRICTRSVNTASILFNRQTCRTMKKINDDTYVYSYQLIIDGAVGIVKAKISESEMRKAVKLELQGLKDSIEKKTENGVIARQARGDW